MAISRGCEKTFTLHTDRAVPSRCRCCDGVDLAVAAGECVVLADPSGAGKSTLLRSVYGNYRAQAGRDRWSGTGADTVDMVGAEPRRGARRPAAHHRLCEPVPARDPARAHRTRSWPSRCAPRAWARATRWRRARALLERLAHSRATVAPLARDLLRRRAAARERSARLRGGATPCCCSTSRPPPSTSSSRAAVVELINEARGRGAATLAIAHDAAVRDAVATRSRQPWHGNGRMSGELSQ